MVKRNLVDEWFLWLTYKSGVINCNILETSKDRPNTPPSLKLSEQRVHELVGGSTDPPPPPLDNVVGSKALRLVISHVKGESEALEVMLNDLQILLLPANEIKLIRKTQCSRMSISN